MASHEVSFGALLRQYRRTTKLTQEELAEKAGLSSKAIGALERGERLRPYKDSLERLATALGLSLTKRADFMAAARRHRAHSTAVPMRSTALPTPLTPLIGREREVAEASRLLGEAAVRLVTLTGPGGVGKTRLAQQIATDLCPIFADGVFFIDLTSLKDPASVLATIAQALEIAEEERGALMATVQQHLRSKQVLLFLDSCDHLGSAVGLVGTLLTTCPRVAVLATSRAVLGLQGEQEMPIAPLALPDPHEPPSAQTLAQYAATGLFVTHVGRVAPDFPVNDATAPLIAEICRQLDGLPLALELAAGWARVFPPAKLLAQLNDRLALLKSHTAYVPSRHRTMRATIEWSYELLDAHQQEIFQRLTIFAGGCTLEAARQICYAASSSELDTAEDMRSLVRQGLLQPPEEQEDGEPRFKMLATIREFGLEGLTASREAASVARKHAAYYLALAQEADRQLIGPAQHLWLDRLERDHENLRSALQWALDNHDTEMALRIAGAAWRYWQMHGYVSEGREWLMRVLASGSTVAAADRAEALNGAGVLACRQGDDEQAVGLLEESVALWRVLNHTQGLARALDNLGIVVSKQGDEVRAIRLHEESRALFASVGDNHGVARALSNLGLIAYRQGDDVRAITLYKESLTLFVRAGDKHGEACSLSNLGLVAYRQGDSKRARKLLSQSLHLFHALGSTQELARSLLGLGILVQRQGEYTDAADLLEKSLSLFYKVGDQETIPTVLCELGLVAHKQGDDTRARALLEESLSLFQARGNVRGKTLCQERLAAISALQP